MFSSEEGATMPEFNPVNEKLKKQYEGALLHGKCLQERTVMAVWKSICLFENFTGREPLNKITTEQAKGFKQWLNKQTTEKGESWSITTIRSHLKNVREFILWLRLHPSYGRTVNAQVAEYLHLSNNQERAARASKPREVPTVKQMQRAIHAMPTSTIIERRNRAVVAFMVITAVRDGAVIGLRLGDVNIEKKTVWQDPKHIGTKFGKGISTTFVPIDPIFENIVEEWIAELIKEHGFKGRDPLFPSTLVEQNSQNLTFEVQGISREHWKNAAPIRQIFKDAFTRAGLPYFHPHTCRHMLINWGMENMNQEEFKALSQSLGHEHAMTSYNAYGCIQPERQTKLIRNSKVKNISLSGFSIKELLEEITQRQN